MQTLTSREWVEVTNLLAAQNGEHGLFAYTSNIEVLKRASKPSADTIGALLRVHAPLRYQHRNGAKLWARLAAPNYGSAILVVAYDIKP